MQNVWKRLRGELPSQQDLCSEVQECLHTRAWWEDKVDPCRSFRGEDGALSLAQLLAAPCFGEREQLQSPTPSPEPYQELLELWDAAVQDMLERDPLIFALWSLGKDIDLAVEGLNRASGGYVLSPTQTHMDQGGREYQQDDLRYRALNSLQVGEAGRALFGDQVFAANGLMLESAAASDAVLEWKAQLEAHAALRAQRLVRMQEYRTRLSSTLEQLRLAHSALQDQYNHAMAGYGQRLQGWREDEDEVAARARRIAGASDQP